MTKQDAFNAGALVAPINFASICAAREKALAEMEVAADAIAEGYALARQVAETAKGANGGRQSYLRYDDNSFVERTLLSGIDRDKALQRYKRSLDAAVWEHIIEGIRLKELMDRTERRTLDKQMGSGELPEPTLENITATVERLLAEANDIFMRGVATAFSSLDPAFKSHDAFKIGKRMIFTRVFNEYGHWSHMGWGEETRRTLADVERVFSQLAGERSFGSLEYAIEMSRRSGWGARQSEVEGSYFKARCFKNGNLHLWIKDKALLNKVNRVLAAYYGEVLADAARQDDVPDDFRPGTAVAKELAFYPTPAEAVAELLKDVRVSADETRILEPQAGVGAICRPLLDAGAVVDAIEVHPDRAEALRGIAHQNLSVKCANFLRVPANPIYDFVIQNPPFEGTHWMDHIRHSWDFLKPGGQLLAILPASAEVGSTKKHERFRAWAEKFAPRGWSRNLWRDLPPQSFKSVGVGINTVILWLEKPRA